VVFIVKPGGIPTEITFATLRLEQNPRLGHANHNSIARARQQTSTKVVDHDRTIALGQPFPSSGTTAKFTVLNDTISIHRDQARHGMRASSRSVRFTRIKQRHPCWEGGEAVANRRILMLITLWPIHAGTCHARKTGGQTMLAGCPEPLASAS